MEKSKILMTEQPLVINTKLACVIGLNEAMVLQQIEYWLTINEKAQKESSFKDGHWWTYNSISEWKKQFPFWSYDTVKRTLKKLRDNGLLITDKFNKKQYDQTLWYRINYEKLNECEKIYISANCPNVKKCDLDKKNSSQTAFNYISANCPNRKKQIAPIEKGKLPQPIPENTKENTKEITSSSTQTIWAKLTSLYEEAFKPLSTYIKNKINTYIEKTNIDFVIATLEYSIEHNAKSPSYFFKTLDNLIEKNITTVQALEVSVTKFNKEIENKKKSTKKSSASNNQKTLNFTNYSQRDYDYPTLENQLLESNGATNRVVNTNPLKKYLQKQEKTGI